MSTYNHEPPTPEEIARLAFIAIVIVITVMVLFHI